MESQYAMGGGELVFLMVGAYVLLWLSAKVFNIWVEKRNK